MNFFFQNEKLQEILNPIVHLCPEDILREEVTGNKLMALKGWLEARVSEGNLEPAIHNALAMILIVSKDELREKYLLNDNYYTPLIIGKFCEDIDINLAFEIYKRGKCSKEIIDYTNRHGNINFQARYLVEEQDLELWNYAQQQKEYNTQVKDEIINVIIPEIDDAEILSTTIKAFMSNNNPNNLIKLLEKILLEGTNPDFRKNSNLQNLLLLIAIKSDKNRVMEYLNQFNEFNIEIGKIAIEAELFEEAFLIFKKLKNNVEAIRVLINNMKDLDRAVDFSVICAITNEPDLLSLYSLLGEEQLKKGLLFDAIETFIKAEDYTIYGRIIEEAKKRDYFPDNFAKYLNMCRCHIQNTQLIDSELAKLGFN